MRERPDDIRVTKTIRSIHAAFEEMMCEMDYSKITVKELCERALINKKTFYRYYETLDFLLAEFQENMMADYLARIEGMRIPKDLEAITREFFKFAGERGEVFERITCANSHAELQRQMAGKVLETHDASADAEESPERALLMAFVSESTLAIYRQWVADGKPIPLEKVTDLAVGYVCSGAVPKKKKKKDKKR